MRRIVLFVFMVAPLIPARGVAQEAIPQPSARDSLFRRARRMVSDGNGAAGRAIVDSLLRREPEGSPAYGDALYWHGALAETAADAERDYRRVIVEYPIALYADDALLALVELEQARGDRANALLHLQRFVREHPVNSRARGVAALAAARLAFDARDAKTGCAMIADARASVSPTDIETRNQIDYFGGRCAAADPGVTSATVPASTPQTTPVVPGAPRDSAPTPPRSASSKITSPSKTAAPAPRLPKVVELPPTKAAQTVVITEPTPVPAAPPARGIYTIQLAAFNTLPDAERLVATLVTRGVRARVSGTAKPFRVRLTFYPTRQAAQEEVALLKQRGIIGFVTTEEPPRETTTP